MPKRSGGGKYRQMEEERQKRKMSQFHNQDLPPCGCMCPPTSAISLHTHFFFFKFHIRSTVYHQTPISSCAPTERIPWMFSWDITLTRQQVPAPFTFDNQNLTNLSKTGCFLSKLKKFLECILEIFMFTKTDNPKNLKSPATSSHQGWDIEKRAKRQLQQTAWKFLVFQITVNISHFFFFFLTKNRFNLLKHWWHLFKLACGIKP